MTALWVGGTWAAGLQHTPEEIATACRASIQLIQQLWDSWPADVDVFNVNVPLGALGEGPGSNRVCITSAAIDSYGALFVAEDEGKGGGEGEYRFQSPPRDTSDAEAQSDTWAVGQGYIAVTPLKARFAAADCTGALPSSWSI